MKMNKNTSDVWICVSTVRGNVGMKSDVGEMDIPVSFNATWTRNGFNNILKVHNFTSVMF